MIKENLMLYKELKEWNVPVTEKSPLAIFKEKMVSIVKEYKEEPITSKSINKFWKGFYGVLGDINGVKYRVPRCHLSSKMIDQITKAERAVIIVPDVMYASAGVEGLCNVFPVRMGWTRRNDKKELSNISHKSQKGSCIVVDTQLSAPHTTQSEYELREKTAKKLSTSSGDSYDNLREERKEPEEKIDKLFTAPYVTPISGYSAEELKERVESGGKRGMGFSTYIIFSIYSELITGEPLDLRTSSRIFGSTYKGEALAIGNHPNGYFQVSLCSLDKHSSILGARSESVMERSNLFWNRRQTWGVSLRGNKAV